MEDREIATDPMGRVPSAVGRCLMDFGPFSRRQLAQRWANLRIAGIAERIFGQGCAGAHRPMAQQFHRGIAQDKWRILMACQEI